MFQLGPEHSAFDALAAEADRFAVRNGVILTGWVRLSGVDLLSHVLGDQLNNVDVITGMSGRATSAEALHSLRIMARAVFVYHTHHRQTFHPKLYLLDDGEDPPNDASLIVGSSNLTGAGLYQNIEGNTVSQLHPRASAPDRNLYDSVVAAVESLRTSPFCEHIRTDQRIHDLLAEQQIATERELGRQQLREEAIGIARASHARSEAPPPPRLPDTRPFGDDALFEPPAPDRRDHRFYVRTPTANDVRKLRGETPGTAEWDIGLQARGADPVFWGWPNNYEPRGGAGRREWRSQGLLHSREREEFVAIEVALWYRPERPDHPAEHRVRIGPRNILLEAVPDDFNEDSLIVIERLDASFSVRLLTQGDADHGYYAKYLRERRPRHSYGYGP